MNPIINSLIKNQPWLDTQKILVAVSGGIDSMVLCHALLKVGFKFGVAHCNYQLRGEASELDALFVNDWANSKQLQCHTLVCPIDANDAGNIQEKARQLRYDFFHRLMTEYGYQIVLTGHHHGDRIETFFMHLGRGAGLKGLVNMSDFTYPIFRPLLQISQKDINEYATQNNIEFRKDSSNEQAKYLRNLIRLEWLPKIKERIPHYELSVQRSIQHLESAQQLIDFYQSNWKKNNVVEIENGIQIKILNSPEDYYLFEYLSELGFHINTITKIKKHLHDSGKQFTSQHHKKLIIDRQVIYIFHDKSELESESTYVIHENDHSITHPLGQLNIHKIKHDILNPVYIHASNDHIYVDAASIQFPLTLRNWQSGDFIRPFGMNGQSKKLQDVFTNLKIPIHQKHQILVIASDQEVLWIVNRMMSHALQVTNHTNEILVFTWTNI